MNFLIQYFSTINFSEEDKVASSEKMNILHKLIEVSIEDKVEDKYLKDLKELLIIFELIEGNSYEE